MILEDGDGGDDGTISSPMTLLHSMEFTNMQTLGDGDGDGLVMAED